MKRRARLWYTCDLSCTCHICKVSSIFTKPLPQTEQKNETVVKRKLINVYPSQETFPWNLEQENVFIEVSRNDSAGVWCARARPTLKIYVKMLT